MRAYRRDDLCRLGRPTPDDHRVGARTALRFPVNYLLDVSVLVAWGWSDHVEHERASIWIASAKMRNDTVLLTSAIPQLGFVRVSVQRTTGQVTVKRASETLAAMLNSLGDRHTFLTDNVPACAFPAWCMAASRTTEAHLIQLAEAHGAKVATLDTGIPGAFLIPVLSAKNSSKRCQ